MRRPQYWKWVNRVGGEVQTFECGPCVNNVGYNRLAANPDGCEFLCIDEQCMADESGTEGCKCPNASDLCSGEDDGFFFPPEVPNCQLECLNGESIGVSCT